MLSSKLLSRIRSISCLNELVVNKSKDFECKSCSALYPVLSGVLQLLAGVLPTEKENWNLWDDEKFIKIWDSYKLRVAGDLPEKEPSKSFCN